MHLRKLFPVLTIVLGLCAYTADAWPRKHANREAKATKVTGCLQKGDQANEYKITAADGKTYGLFSTGSNVNLAEHVGHKVTVTGKYTKPESTGTKTSSSATEESSHLDVTNLKHISNTCQ